MVKHTINISVAANLQIKVLKTEHRLNNVSDVIEKLLFDSKVVGT